MTQEEINDLLERPQPTCASMLDTIVESRNIALTSDAERQRVAEGMSRWCKPQEIEARENRTSAKTALTCEGLEAELSSALSTALAAADRAAALVEAAAAEVAAWAEQLADVVKMLNRIDEAAKAGKEAK